MQNFKTKKIDFQGKDAYLYRDFIILNYMQFFQHQYCWRVLFPNGKLVHSPKNKREAMEWIDEYYKEMNDFVLEELIND